MARRTDSGVIRGMKRIAKAHALLFQAVKKPARPDKFSRKNAQRQQNGERARARRRDHNDTNHEKSKSKQDFEEPLGLMHRFDHRPIVLALNIAAPLSRN